MKTFRHLNVFLHPVGPDNEAALGQHSGDSAVSKGSESSSRANTTARRHLHSRDRRTNGGTGRQYVHLQQSRTAVLSGICYTREIVELDI